MNKKLSSILLTALIAFFAPTEAFSQFGNCYTTAYNMKKKLNDEYSETVTENLVLFFDACSKFKEELSEDDGETND